MTEIVSFFAVKDEYGLFSNFDTSPFIVDGVTFNGNEYYYHYQKYAKSCPEYAQLILKADTPYKAKIIAQQRLDAKSIKYEWQKKLAEQILEFRKAHLLDETKAVPMDKDWEERKAQVMLNGIQHKFEQCAEFNKLLLSTKGKTLVENSPYDSYWGCGQDNKGQNVLGKLLMQVRDGI